MIPYGSLVVFVTPKGRRYIKRLEEGQDWHGNDGVLRAAEAAASRYGDVLYTNTGVPMQVQEATLHDRLKGLKRQTQIIYPKDIAYICLRLGAGPGRTIIEAGCGSGGLTTGLSWFCGPTGRVVSHEAREEFLALARRNLQWAGVGENVELHHRDIAEGFAVSGADALFLDVRTPWEYLDQALAAVRPGATFGFLLPTVDQVGKLLLGLERGPFGDTEVCEILMRRWKPLADRLRPEDRMIAHTGFLIFCRQQDRNADFLALRPLGTRERKQEAARRARLEEDNAEE
ncbi:tRNA (adenine-N1)-methyltransferase [Desulfovibrio legallii]|uniref:tRNA (adenine(58)-N(1))-methyltransferase TrmI n=1 Tax=Desulfovibrio legallii TaxID=571438 RepID=A0A1G7P6G4_9BACT|nr:tRNA (adenine-N1)-methyltransferase [Desulfovibrio legallii]SDF81833.1 tRNA (adenine57-N1/adenine58-N1)-methyltransferase [Desulfovibrio legallii]